MAAIDPTLLDSANNNPKKTPGLVGDNSILFDAQAEAAKRAAEEAARVKALQEEEARKADFERRRKAEQERYDAEQKALAEKAAAEEASRLKAEEEARMAKALELKNKADRDVFIETLSSLFGPEIDTAVLDELWQGYSTYYKMDNTISASLIPDLLIGKKVDGVEVTPLFNKEFATFLKVKANPNSGITTLADFTNARKQYANLMRDYGVGDLATKDNLNKFFDQNISYSTVADRMAAAYDAVNNADDYLKQTLGSLNLRGSDLARAIMLGNEGATELSNRIKTANILAAGLETGYQTTLDIAGLVKSGTNLSRDYARQGFQQTKQEIGAYSAAAQRAGISTADLQKELESENVLGMASQRRKRIQSAEQNLFSGSAGTFTGSLGSRMAAGQI